MDFRIFKKIPRLSREIIITEKIDGTNCQINIVSNNSFYYDSYIEFKENKFIDNYCLGKKDDLLIFAGSRNRWLQTGKNDNMGFASWGKENAEELFELGEGRHYGEWYGKGIQRGYGLQEKRMALFNVGRWHDKKLEKRLIKVDEQTGEEIYTNVAPNCCEVVPILYQGKFDTNEIETTLLYLKTEGSKAVSGFMKPEGIVIYHTASGQYFKKTIENDEKPKGLK